MTATYPSDRDSKIAEIWKGDKLDRRFEADALQQYIESVDRLPLDILERTKSHTIALDAQYGIGKSFFLSRFAEQISLTHPVIYINAWEDDFDDEPLVALASGLKEIIEPILRTGVKQAEGIRAFDALMNSFVNMMPHLVPIATSVLGIVASGLDKAIDTGVNAAKSYDTKIKDALEARINNYQNGRQQIKSILKSLSDVVKIINDQCSPDSQIPLVIIIDELDRCRPTYAVKLLEHVKHLFDVTGIVFIFGMHGDQLSHSVAGAYGAGFDGKDYLRRFINRRFTLESPSTDKIMSEFFNEIFVPSERERMIFPVAIQWKGEKKRLGLKDIFGIYLNEYQLAPRDIFTVFDIMKTSLALTEGASLQLSYLLPLIISHAQGQTTPKNRFEREVDRGWHFCFDDDKRVSPEELFNQFEEATSLTSGELRARSSSDSANYAEITAHDLAVSKIDKRAKLVSYKRLINAVGRVSE